jgi:hypothetical protein
MYVNGGNSKCADNKAMTTIISLVKNDQDPETDTALV